MSSNAIASVQYMWLSIGRSDLFFLVPNKQNLKLKNKKEKKGHPTSNQLCSVDEHSNITLRLTNTAN